MPTTNNRKTRELTPEQLRLELDWLFSIFANSTSYRLTEPNFDLVCLGLNTFDFAHIRWLQLMVERPLKILNKSTDFIVNNGKEGQVFDCLLRIIKLLASQANSERSSQFGTIVGYALSILHNLLLDEKPANVVIGVIQCVKEVIHSLVSPNQSVLLSVISLDELERVLRKLYVIIPLQRSSIPNEEVHVLVGLLENFQRYLNDPYYPPWHRIHQILKLFVNLNQPQPLPKIYILHFMDDPVRYTQEMQSYICNLTQLGEVDKASIRLRDEVLSNCQCPEGYPEAYKAVALLWLAFFAKERHRLAFLDEEPLGENGSILERIAFQLPHADSAEHYIPFLYAQFFFFIEISETAKLPENYEIYKKIRVRIERSFCESTQLVFFPVSAKYVEVFSGMIQQIATAYDIKVTPPKLSTFTDLECPRGALWVSVGTELTLMREFFRDKELRDAESERVQRDLYGEPADPPFGERTDGRRPYLDFFVTQASAPAATSALSANQPSAVRGDGPRVSEFFVTRASAPAATSALSADQPSAVRGDGRRPYLDFFVTQASAPAAGHEASTSQATGAAPRGGDSDAAQRSRRCTML